MNLNDNPALQQLRELVRQCDDSSGHHVLWVRKNGDVEISRVPADRSPAEFEETHPDMQVRFEMFLAGNEYVGSDAADDDDWMSELFESLRNRWEQARGKATVEYIDY